MSHEKEKISRLSIKASLACVLFLFAVSKNQLIGVEPDDSLKKVAILSSSELQASGVSDLLMVQMQELKGVELVERDMLEKVLDQIALTEMFGADQSSNRRIAGKIAGADTLILLSSKTLENQRILQLVISDCRNGARLRQALVKFDDRQMPQTVGELEGIITETLQRYQRAVKHIIGMGGFVSRNLVHDYDHLQSTYSNLLSNALNTVPGVAVLEIEEAQSIRHELELSGQGLNDRVVPVFVRGQFVVSGRGSQYEREVRVGIEVSDSSGLLKKFDFNDVPMDEVGPLIAGDIAGSILAVLRADSPMPLSSDRQFEALVSRAEEFADVSAWEQSIGLREGALLLRPDSKDQRILLIPEYRQYNARKFPRRPPPDMQFEAERICTSSIEHLEYLMANRMVDAEEAVELCKTITAILFWQKRLGMTFLRDVYPKILELEPSVPDDKYYRMTANLEWYRLLADQTEWGITQGRPYKQALEMVLHLHDKVVPADLPPSLGFIDTIKGWTKPGEIERHESYNLSEEIASQEEVLQFLSAMASSDSALCRFYGRFGMIHYGFTHRKLNGVSTEDLLAEITSLLTDIENHKWVMRKYRSDNAIIAELRKLQQQMKGAGGEAVETKEGSIKTEDRRSAGRIEDAISRGKLVFNRIAINVKDLKGTIVPHSSKKWVAQDDPWEHRLGPNREVGMRRSLRCGEGLDVLWSNGAVLFMKEKGLLEEVLVGGNLPEPCFEDVVWDGRHVWVATRRQGIWLLDTDGKIAAKIDESAGLPPAERGLKLCPVEDGQVLASGSFGPDYRAWCATIKYDRKTPYVNVFHTAVSRGVGAESTKDTQRCFVPLWVREYHGYAEDTRTFLIGSSRITPLKIDLDTLNVSCLEDAYRLSSMHPEDSEFLYSSKGVLLEGDSDSVTCILPPGRSLHNRRSDQNRKEVCTARSLSGTIIELDGQVYIPGSVWYRFDIDTLQEERLVAGELPEPYRALGHFWDSAHYGLVGWNWDDGFFQIEITEVNDNVYGYFHRLFFEDEEGTIIKRVSGYKGIVIDVRQGGSVVGSFGDTFTDLTSYAQRWLIPGTYCARLVKYNGDYREFEPVEVTEDTPEDIIFKLKGAKDVHYRGRVVNALTGEPMKGAFVIFGEVKERSYGITHQQWELLHKLDRKVALDEELLWPIRTVCWDRKAVVRADGDGSYDAVIEEGVKFFGVYGVEEGYLWGSVDRTGVKQVSRTVVELPDLRLFPEKDSMTKREAPEENASDDVRLNRITFTTGVTENSQAVDDVNAVSIELEKIYIVTCWNLPLKELDIAFELYDGSGRLVHNYTGWTVPCDHHWHWWCWYGIDKKKDMPGRWRCVVYLDGRRMGEKEIVVTP